MCVQIKKKLYSLRVRRQGLHHVHEFSHKSTSINVYVRERHFKDKVHMQQWDVQSYFCMFICVCVFMCMCLFLSKPLCHLITQHALLHCSVPHAHMRPCTKRYKHEHLHINDILRLSLSLTHTRTRELQQQMAFGLLGCSALSLQRVLKYFHVDVFALSLSPSLCVSIHVSTKAAYLFVCLHCCSVMLMCKWLLAQKNMTFVLGQS